MYAHINGLNIRKASIRYPYQGAWVADVDLDGEASSLSGRVTIAVGDVDLIGTIATESGGDFALAGHVRVVGGAGGWGREVTRKAYHNDASIKASTIAADVAREVGETLSRFDPTGYTGRDYVRRTGIASNVLESVSTGYAWRVNNTGGTEVATFSSSSAGECTLITYSPIDKVAVVAVDSLNAVRVDSILTTGLTSPQTVREIEWTISDSKIRGFAWCGVRGSGRLGLALDSIVRKVTSEKLYGKWRYRVVNMADSRAQLQAVRKGAGLPDVLPVDEIPGIGGAWTQYSPGQEVLIEFVEGDPTMPVLTGASPRSWSGAGSGFLPARTTLGADDPDDAKDAARKGDSVKSILGPFVINAIATPGINGVPQTVVGVVTPIGGVAYGSIMTGSSKIGIGD